MSALVVAVVGVPFLGGVLAVVARRARRPRAARGVGLAAAGLTLLFALLLLGRSDGEPGVTGEWLPGSGRGGLTGGASGLLALAATAGAGLLVFLTAPRGGAAPRPSWGGLLLALAAAAGAFLADHFLVRYVALEIAALCVALAPLVEVREPGLRPHLARRVYLLLRVGDAALLAAILALGAAAGTWSIAPALEAGRALEGARLIPTAAGFTLAAWVKLGGWPFHGWGRAGRRLSLLSHVWLYATVVPNLGAYLLYRITPLLAAAGTLKDVVLWAGACTAVVALVAALRRPDVRAAFVFVGAAQGGLALCVAAAGVRYAVWLGLLVLTPVRLLLFLAAGAARQAGRLAGRRAAAVLFTVGGLALAALGLLSGWWVRGRGGVSLVVGAAVGLTVVWVARTAWGMARPLPVPGDAGEGAAGAGQWVVAGLLAAVVLVGWGAFGPLVDSLISITHASLPLPPAGLGLFETPWIGAAALAGGLLGLIASRTRRGESTGAAGRVGRAREGRLQALQALVEGGVLERLVGLARQGVEGAVYTAWLVERAWLEGAVDFVTRAVTRGARGAYRRVEWAGLERLLRRCVQGVVATGRAMQRWHTGRLRWNLLWFPVALVMAVLALMSWGW